MFDSLIGNDPIKMILRRMLVNARVPRSLLLTGVEGVGKKRFALEIARAFTCREPVNGEACEKCSACLRSEVFSFPKPDDKKEEFERVFFSEHLDIGMVIPCRKNILVGSIRELEREANFRPYEAKARFFIIDDADRMNDSAANALLKTLEEPPATSYIILVTSRPDSLLSTIRSRCQTIRFAPVAANEIERKIMTTEKFSPLDAALVARLSDGSIGRALDFELERFRERRSSMMAALQGLVGRVDHVALLRVGEEMNDPKLKDDYEYSMKILQAVIHDVWSVAHGADERLIVNLDIVAQIKNLASAADPRKLAGWLTEIETLRETLAFNVNRKIATDALFVRMAGA